MRKRCIGIIVAVILLLCALMSVSAAESGNADFAIDEKTRTLLRYNGEAAVVEIPDGIEFIGDGAFENSNVEQVTVPDSVIGIGSRAFSRCEKMTRIRLSAGLLSIGDYAFFDCYALESLELPEKLVYIGSCAFSWYACLDGTAPGYSVIRIPASVVHISPVQSNFSGWTTLDDAPRFEVDAGNRFYRVEDGMLIGHGTLIQYRTPEKESPYRIVTVPEDVKMIAPCAFYGAEVLSVKLPAGLREIGQAAFAACGYLTELTIDCKETLTGRGIVYGCGPVLYDETLKDQLRSLSDDDENRVINEEILSQLPDRPTLTLLNLDEWYASDGPQPEELPWYISSFNGEPHMDMDIDCGYYYGEVCREMMEEDDERYYGLEFVVQE